MASEISVPSALTSELIDRLAALANQPPGVAEVVLSALSYGSLTSLIAQGIVERADTEGDSADPIVITDYGREVIDACARLRQEEENNPALAPSFGPAISHSARLKDDLVDRLAALAGQPDGVAEVALSALSYDSLEALIAHNIIERVDTQGDSADPIVITNEGRTAIAECAAHRRSRNGDGNGKDELPRTQTWDTWVHLGAVARCEGPTPTSDEVLEHVRARVAPIPRARQKLFEFIPGGVLPKLWVDDPSYDLENHVHYVEIDGSSELEQHVSKIFSQELDASKPLWEVWAVVGLDDGGFALLSKVHPELLEGATGVELLTLLYDLESDAREIEVTTDPGPADTRPAVIQAGSAALSAVSVPAALQLPLRAAGGARHAVGQLARSPMQFVRSRIEPAPDSLLNVPIGPTRRVVFVGVSMEDVKTVKRKFGTSVNDVILALVAGALRSWLESRGESADDVELRGVLMTLSGDMNEGPLEERIKLKFAPLPVGQPEAADRLNRVHSAMSSADSEDAALLALRRFAGPTIFSLLGWFRSYADTFNLAVANLHGSMLPLYVAGRRIETLHPVLFLDKSHALAVGAVSHDGGLYISLLAAAEELEDVGVIADGIQDGLDELLAEAAQPIALEFSR